MGDNTITDFCKALGIKFTAEMKSTDAYSELDEFTKRNKECYAEFMDIYDLWKDLSTREVYEGYVELHELLAIPGLITIRGNKIFWSQPSSDGGKRESWEWKSKEQFIRQFLIDPRYQEEVEVLRAQYRAKTRY